MSLCVERKLRKNPSARLLPVLFVTFSLLQKLEAIYRRFAPQKLDKVTELLARYAGREDTLLRLARRKYVDAGSKGGDNAEVVLALRVLDGIFDRNG